MTGAPWRLAGYTVDRLLGAGGDAEVWLGHVAASGVPVALKRIRGITEARVRAARAEAAVLATLDHPNLLRLHEVVIADRSIVLVLDLAAGGSLHGLVAARGRLAPGEVISTLAPVAAALAAVHAAGVVHGDVSAGNVLYTDLGLPLLADLGVARILGEHGTVRTTPGFADPAVAAGHLPGAESDVFMLGACALYALTGQPPWPGDDPDETLAVAASGRLGDLSARLADVPPAVAEVVQRALDLDGRRRGTAADFALDLRHAGTPIAVELSAGNGRRDVLASAAGAAEDGLADRPRRGRHAARPVPRARLGLHRRRARSQPRAAHRSPSNPKFAAPPGVVAAPPVSVGVPGAALDVGRPAFQRPGSAPPGPAAPVTVGARPRPLPARPPVPRWRRHIRDRRLVVLGTLGALAIGLAAWLSWPAAAQRSQQSLVRGSAAAGSPAVRASGSTVTHGSTVTSAPTAAIKSATAGVPTAASGSTARAARAAGEPSTASEAARRLAATATAQLSRLDAIRSRAFSGRQPQLLSRVYAADSLRRQDAALIARIVPAGCGLFGVHTRFDAARAAPTPAGLEMTVMAWLGPSTLRCAATVRGHAPGTGPVRLHIVLLRSGGGYLIAQEDAT